MTTADLARLLTCCDLADRVDRLVLADAMEEAGRLDEAELLRACARLVLVHEERVVSVYDFVYAGYRIAAKAFGCDSVFGNPATVEAAQDADCCGLDAVGYAERGEWNYAFAEARRACDLERIWRFFAPSSLGGWLWFHDVCLRDAQRLARRVPDGQ